MWSVLSFISDLVARLITVGAAVLLSMLEWYFTQQFSV
jgi:hypothetical protein